MEYLCDLQLNLRNINQSLCTKTERPGGYKARKGDVQETITVSCG